MARLIALLALAGALTAAPAAAQTTPPSKQGRCPQGDPSVVCHLWTGKVTFIGDGDTLSVDLDGDDTKKPVRVRMTGINTPEQTVHTNVPDDRVGECHANEATARLEELVRSGKGRVQLAAIDPASMSGSRLRRAVSIKPYRRWRDVGRVLMREGHALWLPGRREWAYNKSYAVRAQKAEAARRNIWNPEECAPGPPANIRFWVNPDPEGDDRRNPNGEWFKVKNRDPVTPLDVSGWRLRDSDLRGYEFPAGTVIAPGATATVFVGTGVDAGSDFFWNLGGPVLDNIRLDRNLGDGGYLFDGDGDLRAALQYPCRYRCFDFAVDSFALRATYKRANEFIGLKNIGSRAVDLEGYRLSSPPYSYVIGPDSLIAPGEELRVYVKGDPAQNTHLARYWGKARNVLGGNDLVELKSPRYVHIVCTAWGTKTCGA